MKIEFFSSVVGVADSFPILESKKNLPSWMYDARREFADKNNKRELTITRCPGIVEALTKGFIVTAWHDIDVVSGENELNAASPSELLNTILEGNPSLQVQSGDGIGKFLPRRPWSNKNILKINTPWHIKSNVKFLMIPIPYTDMFEYESCIGVLDPAISSEINVQGYVNGRGTFTIRAGQPICQLIPLTEEQYTFVVRDMNEEDEKWLKTRQFLNNSTFILNKSVIKSAYGKFINKFKKCPFAK